MNGLILLLNILLPALSITINIFFIAYIIKQKKKINISLRFFLLFLITTLIYSILSAVRSNLINLDVAIISSKLIYINGTFSAIFLFFTGYFLRKKYKNLLLIVFLLPLLLSFLLFSFDLLNITRGVFDWIINMNLYARLFYTGTSFTFTFGALYQFRKVLTDLSKKEYHDKIRFFYNTLIALIIGQIIVLMLAYGFTDMPLTIQLVPLMITNLGMFYGFVKK